MIKYRRKRKGADDLVGKTLFFMSHEFKAKHLLSFREGSFQAYQLFPPFRRKHGGGVRPRSPFVNLESPGLHGIEPTRAGGAIIPLLATEADDDELL